MSSVAAGAATNRSPRVSSAVWQVLHIISLPLLCFTTFLGHTSTLFKSPDMHPSSPRRSAVRRPSVHPAPTKGGPRKTHASEEHPAPSAFDTGQEEADSVSSKGSVCSYTEESDASSKVSSNGSGKRGGGGSCQVILYSGTFLTFSLGRRH